ncbi:MAG: caspase domain-containing protein [Xanthobacteraceae bacterium]|jgi:uncharacterized caspase-like protein
MWKAALPGLIALVTVGLSLVSGEVVKRDNEHKPILALARTGEPAAATKVASDVRASDAQKATPPRANGRPVALVIGNAAYPDAGLPLAQPVNNARAVAAALREQGFEVELGENLTKQGTEDAFAAFKRKIEPGSAALIFFSGFGIQTGRQTYMVPVNAHIWNEADVRRAGVNVEPLLTEIDAKGAGHKLVVIDASRRNPFERRFRAVSMGLAAIHAPDDTLVMYAAAPGKVVSDGETEVSPLMDELVAQIRAPGQTAEEVFNRTRLAISRASNHEQVPWVSSSLVQDFPFAPAEPAKSQHSAR